MKSQEIRQVFTDFFAERGHLWVPSSSLIPSNDPTVLLTTAGMQQMTPYFLGLEPPPSPRMLSIQKCFRTVDIEEVGDESHLTFFEMLGNFSVGDYFKPQAISWAWELLTQVFGVPAERWWPTVFENDDVAFDYWRDEIGIPAERIRRLGAEDNWWGPVGASGPNGPDSEIYYDRGEEFGCGRPDCGPACPHCNRFLETWNLVFMELYKEKDGTQRELPRKNIDTGMGLERIAMILQGKNSVFETDLYFPIQERAAEIAGVRTHASPADDRALRVIADHARAVTFLVGDGVFPGNEGRGYVLRRVLRRAVRYGRLLGIERPFLTQIADTVIEMFAPSYPNLGASRARIHDVLAHEEENFGRTLNTGIARFESLAGELRATGQSVVPGAEAFRLYDTYGFPVELTEELAEDAGLTIDRLGFEEAMAGQRELSRTSARFRGATDESVELYASLSLHPTVFLGYDTTASEGKIVGLLGNETALGLAEAGDHVELLLDRTPFYGEAGGQVGDTGLITTDTGIFVVEDTIKPTAGLIVHEGVVQEGFLRYGQMARATVDHARRADIRRNHTATHLLHAALRATLGPHVQQAGSLVAPDRLRFDFTNLEPLNRQQLRHIQELINEEILGDRPVTTDLTTYQEAVAEGAMALFGEKYGDVVRVVSVPGFSKELCGGTHVASTAEIGLFLITGESSVASGVRRIEAVTGHASAERALRLEESTTELARGLHVPEEAITAQVFELAERLRARERELERLEVELANARLGDVLGSATSVDGVRVLATQVEAPGREALLQMGDRLRERLGSGVVVLGAIIDEEPVLIAMVTRDLVGRGLHAGTIIKEILSLVGGRGGGRAESAQGGGGEPGKLGAALAAVPGAVERQVAG
ncbi:MAG TPA: alanine--tRNA ligase [Thermomicrobiaceae bacterium]|nr:alanine--tRNA ligase [Thermomicrobiaceae bacterium]